MLKRTSITHVNNILNKNLNWKILDIGCGYRAHKNASVIADIQDFSNFYKEREIPDYIQMDAKNKIAKLIRIPKFSEVPYPTIMEPNLVVEYYSR